MALESKIVDNPGVNQSNFDVRVDQSNSDFQGEDRLLAKVSPNINDVPRGYSDEPLFTVKEVASGTQLILRNGS